MGLNIKTKNNSDLYIDSCSLSDSFHHPEFSSSSPRKTTSSIRRQHKKATIHQWLGNSSSQNVSDYNILLPPSKNTPHTVKKNTDMPNTDMSTTEMPNTDMPNTDMPNTDMPNTDMPTLTTTDMPTLTTRDMLRRDVSCINHFNSSASLTTDKDISSHSVALHDPQMIQNEVVIPWTIRHFPKLQ